MREQEAAVVVQMLNVMLTWRPGSVGSNIPARAPRALHSKSVFLGIDADSLSADTSAIEK